MKNTLMSAALLALLTVIASPAAFADHHKGEGKQKEKGKYHMKADTNGDGIMSFDEFITMKKERFAEMDADGDGNLTREEMRNAHKKYRKKYKKTGQELCDKHDAKDSK